MKNMMIGLLVGSGAVYGYTKYKDGSIKRLMYNIKPMMKNTQ